MMVSLATDIADPVERLAAVHRSTSGSKEVTEAIGARNLTELSQLAPGLLIGLGTRLSARFARRGQSGIVNTVVTNVPGPARAAVLRRRPERADVRRRAGRRRHGADQHRRQLRRAVRAVVHGVPRDDARPGALRRLPAGLVRRSRRGHDTGGLDEHPCSTHGPPHDQEGTRPKTPPTTTPGGRPRLIAAHPRLADSGAPPRRSAAPPDPVPSTASTREEGPCDWPLATSPPGS